MNAGMRMSKTGFLAVLLNMMKGRELQLQPRCRFYNFSDLVERSRQNLGSLNKLVLIRLSSTVSIIFRKKKRLSQIALPCSEP
jgi:hypothetical protein